MNILTISYFRRATTAEQKNNHSQRTEKCRLDVKNDRKTVIIAFKNRIFQPVIFKRQKCQFNAIDVLELVEKQTLLKSNVSQSSA